MVIPREAGRTTYSTEIRALKRGLVLSELQRAVVIGSILGDGCLCDNWSKTNYRLKISHSIKQQEYLLWKYGILKDWVLTEPKVYVKTQSITLRTVSHSQLTDLHNIFYKDKKKIIPENIEELLSPITIAIWFMDDGNIRKDGKLYGYYLNTQSFTEKENQHLVDALKSRFDIRFMVINNHHKPRLYIGADRNKFSKIVDGLIIPSLKYKLG